jgi:hypothetical protein
MNSCVRFDNVLAVACLVLGASLVPGTAGAATESETAADMQVQRLEELKERLKLTPEQEAQIKPLVESRRAKMEAIRAKHAGDTSRRAKRSMAQEAKAAAQEFNKQLQPILTEEQRAEWNKIREEAREKVKKEMQERKSSGKETP